MANLITNKKINQIRKILKHVYEMEEVYEAENTKLRNQIANNENIIKKIHNFADEYTWIGIEIEEKDIDAALKEAKEIGIYVQSKH